MNQLPVVNITVTELYNDLQNGLTWLEKDNNGYGSIQDKYNATELQMITISKHPKLINVEPVRVIITLTDDTTTENVVVEEEDKKNVELEKEELVLAE